MPRKKDIPPEIFEALRTLRLRLRTTPAAPSEVKMAWFEEAKGNYGERTCHLAMWFVEADVSLNQVINNFFGSNPMENKSNPGGNTFDVKSGGDMTGVNVGGEQKFRDINVYRQYLDQSGATISAPLKQALIEAREGIEGAKIDAALKPALIEQFDKLTAELSKGDAKNPGLVSGLWTMVYGTVKAIPAAVAAFATLEKLKGLLGL